jgi:hypothetical protein
MKSSKSLAFDLSIAMFALGHAMEVSQLLMNVYAAVKLPWMMAMLALMLYNILNLSAPLKHMLIYFLFIVIGAYESAALGRNWILYISYIFFSIRDKDIDHMIRLIFRCVGTVY